MPAVIKIKEFILISVCYMQLGDGHDAGVKCCYAQDDISFYGMCG